MPLRFLRRFRAGPLRLNVSKSGISGSIGGKGAWYTTGHGRERVSVGIPGSGIGWYRQRRLPQMAAPATTAAPNGRLSWIIMVLIVGACVGVGLMILLR
jgi:hypothetical protein